VKKVMETRRIVLRDIICDRAMKRGCIMVLARRNDVPSQKEE
jgi:hypothetical protein